MPQSAAPMAVIGALINMRSYLLPISRKKVNGIRRDAGAPGNPKDNHACDPVLNPDAGAAMVGMKRMYT
jgi:hypothetical protein